MATWQTEHPITRLDSFGRPVPLMRGRVHQATVLPVAALGSFLAIRADGALSAVAVGIFTASVVAMLAASTAYHCHSATFERKLLARRLDHAMIYVAIGGSQTAYWLLTAPDVVALPAIAIVWTVAALGIHHKLNHLTLTRSSGSWLYGVLGWTGVALLPFLLATDDPLVIASVVAGGLVYTAGGVILAGKLIDPWPGVFGYHEVWHAMVVIGAATHLAGVHRLTTLA